MARTIDDLLAHPVMKDTLEQILGRPLLPQASEVINKKSLDNVPYSLQENPEGQVQKSSFDDNPVPPSLRANPEPPAAPDEVSQEEDQSDEEEPTISTKNQTKEKLEARVPAASAEASSKPQVSPEIQAMLDFGQHQGPNLEEALAAQRQALNNAQIQRGFEQIGGGIAKINPNTSMSEATEKHAGLPIQEFQMRQQQEANNPDSGLSKGLRSYMQKLGVNVSEGATAAQIQQVLPFVFKDIEAKQAQTARTQDLAAKNKERKEEFNYRNQMIKLQREQMQQTKEQQRSDKLEKQDTDRFDKMSKAITAELASSRSAFGQAARNAQSIENAKALLDGSLDYNNLNNRQVYELAKVLDRVLSQSGATISGTEHLTPDTARGYVAKQLEWVTNKNQGAQAGDFVNVMADTFQREEDLAKKQISRTQKSALSSYMDLKDKHPDKFNEVLNMHDIPRSMLEDHATSNKITPDVIAYAKKHGISNEQALAVKNARGG